MNDLLGLRSRYQKLAMPKGMIEAYIQPPQTPDECVFAKTTACLSADFERPITPCQFGGNPDCASCGCVASAGLAAVARHKLRGGLQVGAVFDASFRVGATVKRVREAVANGRPEHIPAALSN